MGHLFPKTSVKEQSVIALDSEGHVVSGQLLSSAMITYKGMGWQIQ